MSFSNISFILHKPQLSENIGSCARAMKNFNFKKLIIVNPKPIFPNDKILATSVGAKEIIRNSKVYEDLESVVNKFDYLIATTSRFRNINLKHIRLNNLNEIDFSKIRSEGYSFQIEMNFRSWRKGFNIIEHPIIFIDRTIGESKMSKSIMYEAVFVVWRLRIWKLFGWNK